MHMAIAVMGFSFGLATTLSITIVVDMTSISARGTTNSLRIMSNRAGQFVLPFGAGLVAAVAGLPGLFLILPPPSRRQPPRCSGSGRSMKRPQQSANLPS